MMVFLMVFRTSIQSKVSNREGFSVMFDPLRGQLFIIQYVLYGRNFPDSTTLTRSPLGSGRRTIPMPCVE